MHVHVQRSKDTFVEVDSLVLPLRGPCRATSGWQACAVSTLATDPPPLFIVSCTDPALKCERLSLSLCHTFGCLITSELAFSLFTLLCGNTPYGGSVLVNTACQVYL